MLKVEGGSWSRWVIIVGVMIDGKRHKLWFNRFRMKFPEHFFQFFFDLEIGSKPALLINYSSLVWFFVCFRISSLINSEEWMFFLYKHKRKKISFKLFFNSKYWFTQVLLEIEENDCGLILKSDIFCVEFVWSKFSIEALLERQSWNCDSKKTHFEYFTQIWVEFWRKLRFCAYYV